MHGVERGILQGRLPLLREPQALGPGRQKITIGDLPYARVEAAQARGAVVIFDETHNVKNAAAAAATAAVGQLLRAVSSERGATVTRGGPSIEDVVREELRPLLKAWLDAHLPATVERLVRAEIERVMARQG